MHKLEFTAGEKLRRYQPSGAFPPLLPDCRALSEKDPDKHEVGQGVKKGATTVPPAGIQQEYFINCILIFKNSLFNIVSPPFLTRRITIQVENIAVSVT